MDDLVGDGWKRSGVAGGSRHGAWPEQGLAFSYLMNEVRLGPDRRPLALLEVLDQASK